MEWTIYGMEMYLPIIPFMYYLYNFIYRHYSYRKKSTKVM